MAVNRYIDTVTIVRAGMEQTQLPLYRAIANAISAAIQDGRIRPETKLPPLRNLADALSVTVGTIGRAYTEIRRLGLTTCRVGDGTYVFGTGEPAVDIGFENAPQAGPAVIDLSRNTNIQGEELNLLAEMLKSLAHDKRALARLSEYLPDAGLAQHREAGARWLLLSGRHASPENIIVTNGAQHALLCTMMAILRTNDLVVTEHLSYPGLASAAKSLGLRLAGLPFDAEGLIPTALRDMCRQQKVQAIYCTPTIQNPTTGVMSSTRRCEIADICSQYNIRIIEDDAHGLMTEVHPPSFADFIPSLTITISSLSKAVSAGLRVGFIAAPQQLVARIASAVRLSCWMATPLTMEVGARWILDGTAEYLRIAQQLEVRRRKSLVEPLLADLEFRTHEDCCHFWINLPEPLRGGDLAAQLESRQVLIKVAEAFAIGLFDVPQCVRVSVSGAATDAALLYGVRVFADTIREGSYPIIQ